MTVPTWIVMRILGARDYTITAIADCLAQTVPVRLLLINQGVDSAFRDELEALAEEYRDRIFCWHHQPPLLSLAATWNRALDFVWEAGGIRSSFGRAGTPEAALVVNNDVRLRADTVAELSKIRRLTDALFVSAVGVREEQFDPTEGLIFPDDPDADQPQLSKGGPDFSCFLISRACHDRFRFDEAFIPAYCEDLDTHRRLLLAGEGHRIFSVNLPYVHYAAGTL